MKSIMEKINKNGFLKYDILLALCVMLAASADSIADIFLNIFR